MENAILTSPFRRVKGLAQGHTAGKKQTHDCVTSVPTLPTGSPCSLWHALGLAFRSHPTVVPLFPSLESPAQALALRSWGRRQRSQGEGSKTGTRGCGLARAKPSLSPPAPVPSRLSSTPSGYIRPTCVPSTHAPVWSSFMQTRFGRLLPAM